MACSLVFQPKPTYLHAIVTGSNTKENVRQYLSEVSQECKARGYSRVLIEERLEGPRLSMMEVYAIVSEGSLRGGGQLEIAFVDVNAEGDLMQFAETLAVNRAMDFRVFSTVAEAEEQLLRKDQVDRSMFNENPQARNSA
jgi:hypothetical protein